MMSSPLSDRDTKRKADDDTAEGPNKRVEI